MFEEMKVEDANLISPLIWAYVGDAVYELYIRSHLVKTTKLKPHKLHIEAIKYVKASAQANILKNMDNFFTEEEKEIIRRARNTKNHHVAKNAEVEDYRYSTAFEGLIGYLYLSGKNKRLEEILNNIIRNIDITKKSIYNKQAN